MKKIGIILLVIVAAFLLISFFLPSKIHVERSIAINAPAKVIFNQVNTLTTWKNWSYWDQIDPNMKSEFEGPESGAGAVHKWESDNDSVGVGSLTIVESVEPTSIITSLYFEGMGSSMGGWNFQETEAGVNASIYMDIEMPFVGRIFPGLMMNKMLGKDFDKSLNGLKTLCENMPAVPDAKWTVEMVNTESAHVMCYRYKTKPNDIQSAMGEGYSKIVMEMGKQELHQSGAPFAIYHKWEPNEADVENGIPVEKSGKTNGDITATELPSTKALKIDFYGDYNGLGEAHEYINHWASSNNVNIIGPPWEEYITDPSNEPDTTKWLTRVYYPAE